MTTLSNIAIPVEESTGTVMSFVSVNVKESSAFSATNTSPFFKVANSGNVMPFSDNSAFVSSEMHALGALIDLGV